MMRFTGLLAQKFKEYCHLEVKSQPEPLTFSKAKTICWLFYSSFF